MSSDTPASRRPGDPVPAQLVQEYRRQAKLTQEQLAERLGVRGGKPVISGWETGRTSCEGPAAEFLLHLMGRGNSSVDVLTLHREMSSVWERAGNHVTEWRQILAVPDRPVAVPTQTFVSLFPPAALQKVHHGFPFTGVDLPGEVVGITQGGWLGSIPSAPDRPPTYLWMLKRDGRFGYRERLWEDDPTSEARGQLDVGSLLKLALQTTYFLRQLAPILAFDPSLRFTLQLHVEGARGRGLIDAGEPWKAESRETTWSEDQAQASAIVEVSQLLEKPFDAGVSLVSELAGQISAEYARPARLRQLLSNRKRQGGAFAFVDDVRL
jgi:transcriptional regulator with XRE-family HTH domain